MRESLDNSRKELKRAEHLIFVSLKYTRTVDVIKNIIERLVNAYDFGMDSLFKLAKSKKQLVNFPTAPLVKAQTLKTIYSNDPHMANFVNLYLLFRKIKNAKFSRAREYRRHVTMTAFLDDGEVEINIDIITEYYEKTNEFIDYCSSLIEGKND
ncbi:hypothetical protein JW707_00070 [Candidatus Woesearchaeota archaeon]|nr:hypothetical protein [Candidatus Woesearchaeota archaeon]